MFTTEDFQVFTIEGLEPRMAAIRQQIQPKFQALDDFFVKELEPQVGENLYIHIAQHRRRTTHAPENTWSAISRQKRGYKMEPHFQLGINAQYIFMWLSCIDQPKNEKRIAENFLQNIDLFTKLPDDFVVSLDHTVETIQKHKEIDLRKALLRFRDVKKGEFQIGRVLFQEEVKIKSEEELKHFMYETYQILLPLYQKAIVVSGKE